MNAPAQRLGWISLACWLATLAGWTLVYGGLHHWFAQGEPGWANLAALVWGLTIALVGGAVGLGAGLAALSERNQLVVRIALLGNAFSVLGVPLFVLCIALGAFGFAPVTAC